jgi:hypothetical protein
MNLKVEESVLAVGAYVKPDFASTAVQEKVLAIVRDCGGSVYRLNRKGFDRRLASTERNQAVYFSSCVAPSGVFDPLMCASSFRHASSDNRYELRQQVNTSLAPIQNISTLL